jgi:hypothetical protein
MSHWPACAVSRRYFCFLLSALCFPSAAALPRHSSFFILHSPRRGFGWLRRAVRCWMLDVGCWMFSVRHKPSEHNSPPSPPSRWSGGTLDKPWTCPGTIEPPQITVFDQPRLSRPLSCGISATERIRRGAALWSAGTGNCRLCGPCSAILDSWAAALRHSALCILHSPFASAWL